MIKKTFSTAVAITLAAGLTAAHAEIGYGTANQQILEAHILPGYAELARATESLHMATEAYCADAQGTQEDVQLAFGDAMGAWQSIQHIRFGPISEDDRHFRLEFWPDTRNKTGKALASLKQDMENGQTIDAERIAQTSVAAQGFPALERLLFDADAPLQSGSSDCTLAMVITANVEEIGQATNMQWTEGGFAATALGPDGYYQTPKDLAFELFKTLQTTLQWIEDSKLRRPMGDNIDNARGTRVESWRSKASLDHIGRNIEAIEAFYSGVGEGGFAAVLQQTTKGTDLHWGMVGKFREIKDTLAKVDLTLHDAVSDAAARRHLDQVVAELREMRRWVDQDMATILDMPLGFNSLDGD